jgi:DNA-binding MarR family transcriptional regulator
MGMPARPDLLHLLECLGRLLTGELRAQAGDRDLQLVHLQALDYLRRANRYSNTPRALADYLGLTKGTVSQTLLLLHRKELVLREEDPADRRVVRLRLSPRGRELVARRGKEDPWRRALRELPAAERAGAGRALLRLLAGVQRQRGNLGFGECRTCRHFRREERGFRCGLTGEPLRRPETLQICREHAWAEGA